MHYGQIAILWDIFPHLEIQFTTDFAVCNTFAGIWIVVSENGRMNSARMAITLLMVALGASHCSDDSGQALREAAIRANAARSTELVRTQDDLLAWLQQRYGPVEEIPFQGIFRGGVDNRVELQYRLDDGRILTIPIVYTVSGERLLAEDFDLDSLGSPGSLGSLDSLDYQPD
jgi:hypothetical protein